MISNRHCVRLLFAGLLAFGLAACGDGDDGAAGPSGEPGPAGPAGGAGPEGPAGPTGQPGPDGAPGPAGGPGSDGAEGVQGTSTRVALTDIPPGERGCEAGGTLASWFRGIETEPYRETVICAGVDGPDGTDGAEGPVGDPGPEGFDASVACAGIDPLRISGIDAPEQRFYRNLPSEPISLLTNFDPSTHNEGAPLTLRIRAIAPNARAIDLGDGQFQLVAQELGGPYSVVLVATDGCTRDITSLAVDEVLPANARVRLVHAAPGIADTVRLERDGEEGAVATATALDGSAPVAVEAGLADLAFYAGSGETPFATLDDFVLGLDATITFHVWAGPDGPTVLPVNEDLSPMADAEDETPENFRVTVLHLAASVGVVDILDLDAEVALVEGLETGGTAGPLELPTGDYRLGIDTGEAVIEIDVPGAAIPPGTVVSLAALEPVTDFFRLMAVFVDDADATGVAFLTEALPEELPVLDGTTVIEDVVWTTSEDHPWTADADELYQGNLSFTSGRPGHNGISWLEISFEAPRDGQLRWAWQVESEGALDFLAACWQRDDMSTCSRTSFDDRIVGGPFDAPLTPWQTAATGVVDEGETVTVRFAYVKDGSVDRGRDRGWISDLRWVDPPPPPPPTSWSEDWPVAHGADELAVSWFSSDEHPWAPTTEESFTGESSLESGSPGHNGVSWAEVTFEAPTTGRLAWHWQVESEGSFDYLQACWQRSSMGTCVRGSFEANLTGGTIDAPLTPWTSAQTDVIQAGDTVTVRFAYVKDGSVDRGRDRGWVDNLRWVDGN